MRRLLTLCFAVATLFSIDTFAGPFRYKKFTGDIKNIRAFDEYLSQHVDPVRSSLFSVGRNESGEFLKTLKGFDDTILNLHKEMQGASRERETEILVTLSKTVKEREEHMEKGFRDYLTAQGIKATRVGDALNVEFPASFAARTGEAEAALGGDHTANTSSARAFSDARISKSQADAGKAFVESASRAVEDSLSNTLSPEARAVASRLIRGALTTFATDRLLAGKRLSDTSGFVQALKKIVKDKVKSDADAELIANAIVGNKDPKVGADLIADLEKYFSVEDPARRARVLGGVTALYGVRRSLADAVRKGGIPEEKVPEYMGEWIGLGDKFRSWLYKDVNGKKVLDDAHLSEWISGNAKNITDPEIRKLVEEARRTKVYPDSALCRTIRDCAKENILCQAA